LAGLKHIAAETVRFGTRISKLTARNINSASGEARRGEMASSQPNMEKFLRDWRQDALNKAQYDSAIFVGDKLLAMTSMNFSLVLHQHYAR
jgi:hypothetical protein